MGFEAWVLLLVVVGLTQLFLFSAIAGITPVPTSTPLREEIIGFIQRADDPLPGPILELGCGWGALAMALARANPDRQVEAFELSPLPWLVTRLRLACSRVDNLTVHPRSFRRVPLPDAAFVVCYLCPSAMRHLAPRLSGGQSPGTWILSNTFELPGWRPGSALESQDDPHTPVWVYRR